VRQGVVLSNKGGILAKLAPLFNLGGGGNIGSGNQVLSWISLFDSVRAIEFALDSSKLTGPVNVCAPNPATNREFTRYQNTYLYYYELKYIHDVYIHAHTGI
jgi:NAD dependent epimerase/dehydratase family enzyme